MGQGITEGVSAILDCQERPHLVSQEKIRGKEFQAEDTLWGSDFEGETSSEERRKAGEAAGRVLKV